MIEKNEFIKNSFESRYTFDAEITKTEFIKVFYEYTEFDKKNKHYEYLYGKNNFYLTDKNVLYIENIITTFEIIEPRNKENCIVRISIKPTSSNLKIFPLFLIVINSFWLVETVTDCFKFGNNYDLLFLLLVIEYLIIKIPRLIIDLSKFYKINEIESFFRARLKTNSYFKPHKNKFLRLL